MVSVKLKEGIKTVGNAKFELVEGRISNIPDDCFNPDIMEEVGTGKKPEKNEESKEEIIPQKSFRQELIDLPGIGPKIADQFLKVAKTKEALAKVPREKLIKEFRDDVVVVLDKYLKR